VDAVQLASADEYSSLEGAPNTQLFSVASPSSLEVMLAPKGQPGFRDPRVRLALNYGVNRRAFVDSVLRGHATTSVGPYSTVLPFARGAKPLPYDKAKAKELLKEAGQESLKFTLFTFTGSEISQQVGEYVQGQLSQIGVTVNVRPVDASTYLNAIAGGTIQAGVITWTNDVGDLTYRLGTGGSLTAPGFSDSRVDSLLNEVAGATSEAAAVQAGRELETYLRVTNPPAIYIAYPDEMFAVNSKFTGISPTPTNFYANLAAWTIK
jgi:ABC-type transport system substrate-binding protein